MDESSSRASLFRKEAIDNKRNRLHGDILLVPRLSHTLILAVLGVWVLVLIIWLTTSTFTRKETVFGWLAPPDGVVRVYPQSQGVIKTLHVKEGEQVAVGDILLTITGDRELAGGEQLNTQLLNEYNRQSELVAEQIALSQSIFDGQKSELQQRLAAANSELTLIDSEISTFAERAKLLSSLLEKSKKLRQKGHISGTDLDNIHLQKLVLDGELQSLNRTRVTQQNSIAAIQAQLSLLPRQRSNAQAQLQERLSTIDQQASQLKGQQSYVITAPRDGTVNNVQAIAGQQVAPNRDTPLLTIMPSNAKLTAYLLVPVRSAGFLEAGQALNIRYDAFPYQKFGMYSATIESVSNTLLLPNEILNAPIAQAEPAYQITAVLDKSAATAYGREFPLKPGMTLTADIQLSERTLLEWFLEPLLSLRGNL